ncbi:MAG: chromosome segregation SMC family protein [Conexivisphaerales archaeon]
MVFISRLTLKGFKSFPTKPVTVVLEPGFNAITGPNGSGKSNIMDAIRFVLGENSPKALRHNKMSDVINDQSRDELGAVRVSLTLDNSDRSLPLDTDKVVVSRELHKNGDSTYFIDGRRVPRNHYLEFLGAAHLTPDGLNIVAQGTIQRLSELTPDERRAAVEQYLGLKHFDEKKAEAMARLREADNELAVSFAKLDEKREAIERLQAERNDALRLRQVQREIARIRKSMLLATVNRTEDELQSANEKIKQLQRIKSDLEASTAIAEDEKHRLENEREEYYSTRIAGPNMKLTEIGLSIAQKKKEAEYLEQRKLQLLNSKASLEQAIPKLRSMQEAAITEINAAQNDLNVIQQQVKTVQDQIDSLTQKVNALQTEALELQRRKGSLVPKENTLVQAVHMLQQKKNELDNELQRIVREVATFREQQSEMQKKRDDLIAMTNNFKSMLDEIGRILPERQKELSEIEDKIKSYHEQKKNLSKEIQQAEKILDNARETVTKYVSGKELAERFLGEELNVVKIEELAQTGAINGFHGILQNIISFDPKYGPAIKATGQEWLYSFVVDDVPTLVEVASLAKRLKTGRIKILPLSELEGTPVVEVPNEQGVLGVVSEFVKCSKEYRAVVEFAFGNTLLADTAKNAFLVSQKGYRCVSLNGDLFESNVSAMETGKIRDVTLVEIGLSDLESVRIAEESLKSLKDSLDRRKRVLEKLDHILYALEDKKLNLLVQIRELGSNLKTYRSFLKRYTSLSNNAEMKLSKITSLIKRYETRTMILQQKIQSISERISKINERISSIGIEELEKSLAQLQASRASLMSEIDDKNRTITSLNTEISKHQARLNGELRPRLEQIESTLSHSLKELASIESELPGLESKLQDLQRDLDALSNEQRVVREEDERALPRLKEIEDSIKNKEQQISSYRQQMLRLDREIIKMENEVQTLQGKKETVLSELSSLDVEEEVYFNETLELLLSDLKQEEAELKDKVNLLAPQNYQEAFISYRSASERRNELEKDRNAIVSFIEKIEGEKKSAFMMAFEKLDREVRSIFHRLTGGEGWLELEEPDDPFAGGIFLMARFQNSTPRESSSLSGGEKAISALPFLLAFQTIYPSGFYLFDEVDAALDPLYAQGLGSLLAEWAQQAQIIAISFKESVISNAANLIGVYKTNGLSNVVRLKRGVTVDVKAG